MARPRIKVSSRLVYSNGKRTIWGEITSTSRPNAVKRSDMTFAEQLAETMKKMEEKGELLHPSLRNSI